MDAFIQKYRKDVTGVLSGWDRVRMRAMQRILANAGGMMSYLSHVGVWLKDFGALVERTCLEVRQASEQAARRLDRPVLYLSCSSVEGSTPCKDSAIEIWWLICTLRPAAPEKNGTVLRHGSRVCCGSCVPTAWFARSPARIATV